MPATDTQNGGANGPDGTMKHLLNCRNCDWHTVVEGPSCVADVTKDNHVDSIRNWRSTEDHCPVGSVAWAFLPSDAEVNDE